MQKSRNFKEIIAIKVVIAEDMDILSESLKYMIESDGEMEVVGLAANDREAFEMWQMWK